MRVPLFVELPDGRTAAITDHLLDRWQESVCPAVTRLRAVQLLDRWLGLTAVVFDEAPVWALRDVEHPELEVAWIVAGDFALPVLDDGHRLYLPTIISRGTLPTTTRRSRNHQARAARAIRAARRRHREAQEARSGDRRRRRSRLAPAFDDQDAG